MDLFIYAFDRQTYHIHVDMTWLSHGFVTVQSTQTTKSNKKIQEKWLLQFLCI